MRQSAAHAPANWWFLDRFFPAFCLPPNLPVLPHLRLRTDLRLRFLAWWGAGYNNAFGYDEKSHSRGRSVGLGGNIGAVREIGSAFAFPAFIFPLILTCPALPCLAQSFTDFVRNPGPATAAGDRSTSGNGSIMRLAPVPICYARDDDRHAALETAWAQSKTTHQGLLSEKGVLLKCKGDSSFG